MNKWWMAAMVALAAGGAWATENGGGAYPNGAEDFMAGAVPPPGDYLLTYGLHYKAGDLMNGDGKALPIPFDAEVNGLIFRYIHVTPVQVAGAQWAQHLFVPVLQADVTTPGGSDDQTGIGDIIVDPFILAWHKPPFHYVAGIDVYLPVGAYDKSFWHALDAETEAALAFGVQAYFGIGIAELFQIRRRVFGGIPVGDADHGRAAGFG